MRILLINPNMTEAMTVPMTRVARAVAGQDAEIVPLTATMGFPYIASRAEAQIAGANVLDMIAENRSEADAVIIAAFGDPGLIAAREVFDLPIIGMAEAAVLTAAMLGERFSIVTFSPHMARWYTDCVHQTGLAARFTGVRCPDEAPASVDNVAEALRGDLIDLTKAATALDGADVVILGGAPLAGLATELAGKAPGLLIDPIAAATAQAMSLARLAPDYRQRVGRPEAKASSGLGQALTDIIAGGQA
ncbi:aspartate/glutamate racemase family protein [Marivita sp. XM-24bin2]|jgi:Asp/Glu/hydantoin racemase|uniref:aspartate/glutamate racemase family protein n=1 Tax=unclassified Marivita TaxID=2632480 RepID=UPI000D7A4405|nr:aspartate/glutamate racemase family protein [Marivita sp. XM-24bin2]MCR9107396.1 aspartate/glutamate racemase family protein [Paracoccaceae bacterium]PWL32760.1 MAG: hydrogenase expression protein HupH [Marivita sp. XM-24bin2]